MENSIAVADLMTLEAFQRNAVYANSKFSITDGDGDKQTQEIHTSCAVPLNVGDQFGSLILTEFIPRD